MQVEIKMPDDLRINRVSVEAKDHVVIEIGERESAANVLDQAERAGKVPALEHRVQELLAEVNGLRGQNEGLAEQAQDLSAAVTRRVQELEHAEAAIRVLKAQLTSANQASATGREADAETLETFRKEIDRQAARLSRIRDLVTDPQTTTVRETTNTRSGTFLADVIGQVADTLDAELPA